MRTAESIAAVEEILALESASLVRYVVEVAQLSIVDGSDEKTLPYLQDFYHEVERNVARLLLLLAEEEVYSTAGEWPLRYPHFNFLKARSVLPAVIEDTRERIEAIERASAPLASADWPAARETIRNLLDGKRLYLERLEKFAKESPEDSPEPPELKGTSASRW